MSDVFSKIKPTQIHHEVQEQLRRLIDEGILKPGQSLPSERALAEQLGVSRNSLREALRVLESRGILITRHGVGRIIREVGASQADPGLTDRLEMATINDVLEVRELLEPRAAVLACSRRTETELDALLAAAAKRDDWQDNVRFHHAIVVAAHNNILESVIVQQMALLENLQQRDRYSSARDADVLIGEHEEIANAIASRDAALAERLVRNHLQRTHALILRGQKK